ncbi:MAG: PTS sugar transporter subunit IIC [Clostridia bacterium]|nr:PTS sugar transporter subunit IIC [Clostridia bacterium]
MKKFKEILSYIFVDGLSGMALGLFATLIIGTILDQIAGFIPGIVGTYLGFAAAVAKSLTGAGIGAGMSFKYKTSPLTGVSACVAGMVGAFASKLIAGTVISSAGLLYSGPGDPLGAFIGAFCAIQIGRLVSGKTKVDIILTPACSIIAGSAAGLLLGPPISSVTTKIGELIAWGTERQPVMMGIIVSVIMGICLTLPISSAALGIILGLNGIAGGAAVVGCCCQMVGFAVQSYRENKVGGLLAQGIGTSMLQMPNIVKHPQIWIPPIIASAILGPISTKVLGMTCNASGSGMGTSGLVGQFMTFQSMSEAGVDTKIIIIEMLIMHFIAPAVICFVISELMRKKNFIESGDMKLDL